MLDETKFGSFLEDFNLEKSHLKYTGFFNQTPNVCVCIIVAIERNYWQLPISCGAISDRGKQQASLGSAYLKITITNSLEKLALDFIPFTWKAHNRFTITWLDCHFQRNVAYKSKTVRFFLQNACRRSSQIYLVFTFFSMIIARVKAIICEAYLFQISLSIFNLKSPNSSQRVCLH